jgi:hypothetical protein
MNSPLAPPEQLGSQILQPASAGYDCYKPLANPLTEIRLVILEPALLDGEEIRCELKTTNVASAKYEALSYAWGESTIKTPIILCGERRLVTTNLAHALRSLRTLSSDSGQKRSLWIDALCINQENDAERNEQVGRMGWIYKSAERVLVWLGNYYEREDDLVRFETRIWGFGCQNPGTWETTKDAFKLAEALSEESNLAGGRKVNAKNSGLRPTRNLHTWGFLSIICQRSWFRRLWVIQEITMARKGIVCCGRVQLRWRILERAADRVAQYFESPEEWPFFAKLKFIDEMTSFAGNISIVGLWDVVRSNVLSIIIHTQYSEATDARDRLYAIKALLSSNDTDIKVDYSESTNIAYRKWALRRIRRTRCLDVLTLCTDTGSVWETTKLPSWVPDLRRVSLVDDTFFNLANGFSQNHEHAYAAAGETTCDEKMLDEGLAEGNDEREPALLLQGLHIDTITKKLFISDTFGIGYSTDQLSSAVTLLEQKLSEHFKSNIHRQRELYDAFLDSIFKGWKWYVGSYPTETLATRYKVWRGRATIPADFQPYMNPAVRLSDFLGTLEMILRLMLRVSDLFITSNGLIGSMSKHCGAEVGDKIYVLFGGNAPFILKPLKGERVYQLRSACFLHGYMHGEAIVAWKKGDLNLETVKII